MQCWTLVLGEMHRYSGRTSIGCHSITTATGVSSWYTPADAALKGASHGSDSRMLDHVGGSIFFFFFYNLRQSTQFPSWSLPTWSSSKIRSRPYPWVPKDWGDDLGTMPPPCRDVGLWAQLAIWNLFLTKHLLSSHRLFFPCMAQMPPGRVMLPLQCWLTIWITEVIDCLWAVLFPFICRGWKGYSWTY